MPEKLLLARAKCSTPEILGAWFKDFGDFLEAHSLLNRAECIWNADEAGFPLCATSGKDIIIHNCKDVYAITADMKEKITTLCAINAAGDALPPMHIFPGTRFKYNPMFVLMELTLVIHQQGGFLLNFSMAGLPITSPNVSLFGPVVLLVDGYSSHIAIDLHTSTFCKENRILVSLHIPCI